MLGPNKGRKKRIDPYELPEDDEVDDDVQQEPERPRVEPYELPEDSDSCIPDDELYDKCDWSSQPIYQ